MRALGWLKDLKAPSFTTFAGRRGPGPCQQGRESQVPLRSSLIRPLRQADRRPDPAHERPQPRQ